jgi:hypothetical protein
MDISRASSSFKTFYIGASSRLRHQWKAMDVSLKNFEKSKREHFVYYLLRDHFSGVFYVEMASGNDLTPVNDFLLRAWLEKPESAFCGIPTALMIPKAVENYFPSVDRMLNELKIEKIYPPSGFASGIRDIPVWEEQVRFQSF